MDPQNPPDVPMYAPLSAPSRLKMAGLVVGFYPFWWDLTIERYGTMTTICVGPFQFTLHH